MVKFEPGQLVKLTSSVGVSLDKPVLYSNGKYTFPVLGELFTVLTYPCNSHLPKYSSKPEAWCEVVDSEGRVGAFYPASWLKVVE